MAAEHQAPRLERLKKNAEGLGPCCIRSYGPDPGLGPDFPVWKKERWDPHFAWAPPVPGEGQGRPIDRARPTRAANRREEADPQGGWGRAGAKPRPWVPGAS